MKPYIVSFFSSTETFDDGEVGYELYRLMNFFYRQRREVWFLYDGSTTFGKSVAVAVCSGIEFGTEDFMLFDCQKMIKNFSGGGNKIVDISDVVFLYVERVAEKTDPIALYCRQQDKLFFNLCDPN